MLREGILDNAGKAVTTALATLGFDNVLDVRIGKTYFIECEPDQIKDIAEKLVNEVMETYMIAEDFPMNTQKSPYQKKVNKNIELM